MLIGTEAKPSVGGVAVTAKQLESVQIHLQAHKVRMSLSEKFNLASALGAWYICRAVSEMLDRGLTPVLDYRIHWWKVLRAYAESEERQALARQSPQTKEEVKRTTSKLGVEGEGLARVGPEIVRILTGKTVPLALTLKGNLLFRMYLGDEGARTNRYIAEYTRLLTQHKRDLRILEIGAGTGGTTF